MRRPKRPTVDLLVVFAGVFAVQQVAGAVGLGVEWFALATPVRRPWTLIATVYAHAGLGHLLATAVGLVVVGLVLERSTTRARFPAFVLVTGIVSASAESLVGVALAVAAAVTLLTAGPGVALVAHGTGFAVGVVAGRAGVLRADAETGRVDPS